MAKHKNKIADVEVSHDASEQEKDRQSEGEPLLSGSESFQESHRDRLRGGLDMYADLSDGYERMESDFFHSRRMVGNMHWSIAWSDLMMTMFILFMVMFVYKTADREFLSSDGMGKFFGEKIGREVTDNGPGGSNEFHEYGQKAFSKLYDFSELTSLEKELQEFAEIDLEPDKTVRIIVTGDLLFRPGETKIAEQNKGFLKKIALFLQETPYKINVIGHTDDMPIRTSTITPTNWELSTNRACSIVHYLIKETQLPASQFYVTGHGEYQPVVPNNSAENRAKNRRVEIVVTQEMPEAQPLGSVPLKEVL